MGFKQWFKERYPEPDNPNAWFAYRDERIDDAMERLGDAIAEYVDEQMKKADK